MYCYCYWVFRKKSKQGTGGRGLGYGISRGTEKKAYGNSRGSIKKEVKFSGVIKEKSCGMFTGLGFWSWNFQGV